MQEGRPTIDWSQRCGIPAKPRSAKTCLAIPCDFWAPVPFGVLLQKFHVFLHLMKAEMQPRADHADNTPFAAAQWRLAIEAGNEQSPHAPEALEKLCRIYWLPLYAYVRRRGYRPEDAEDLTQQFFAVFLRNHGFQRADPTRGRFSTYMLHSLRNFLTNEWKRSHRIKRGHGAQFLSLDLLTAENRDLGKAANNMTPEVVHERHWGMTLIEQVLNALREEYTKRGDGDLFEQLSALLWGKDALVSYVGIRERFGMSEEAVRGAMHRLRRRFRQRLRAEVAHTVDAPGHIDAELQHLFAIVGGKENP